MAALWLLSALTPGTVRAQGPPSTPSLPPGPVTLEQVLAIAESRSEAVSMAREGVRRAEGDQVRAHSGLLPQLSASASYDRALASEFEGVFEDGFFGDDDAGSDTGFEDLPFGRENTWRASLALSQNLYSGGRLGAQAAVAAAGRSTAEVGLTTARAQALLDVTEAYYDAVLAERLAVIAEATYEQAGATLRQVEAGFGAGAQPEFEVLRAGVTRDGQRAVVIRQRASRDIALLRLKQLLDLPASLDLRLADALGDETLPPSPAFVERVAPIERALRADGLDAASLQLDGELPARTAVAEADLTVQFREASLRLTRAQRMPSATLTSSYSRVGYPSGVLPSLDRANWSVGASLTLPILTGGRQRGDEIVARAELEQSRLQRQQVEELAGLETRAAWAELRASHAAWEATSGTVEQADRAYEIAGVRYGAGVSTQLELTDARLLRQQAEVNRAQAARDLQVARARVALLPDLPLGAVGAGPAPVVPTPRAPAPTPAPQAPLLPRAPQAAGQFTTASAQVPQ
jgi:outer membrane protein TolC